jgi:tetratricopeptide (TPR) repeat protein
MSTSSKPDPADGLSAEQLAGLLSPPPAGISPERLPADLGERFEVRGLLGEGGQGVVLAVHDRRLERDVAAKMPRAGRTGGEANLEREARLAASLEHPSILPTYDLAETPQGTPLLLMRRAPGRSLEESLRAAGQPTASPAASPAAPAGLWSPGGRAARLRVFLQLAEAVSYAHSRGILHLDIKPANVRVGDFGEVFVMDWGLARRITESSAPVGGTVPYMAPELLDNLAPDERADVHALGVTLYRMLSNGALPWPVPVRSTEEYRVALRTARPVPLAQRQDDIDPDLAAVVDKACHRDRNARYRHVRDMVADLEAAIDGRPVTARRASLPELAAKLARRHSRLLGFAAALLALAVTAGALGLRERSRRHEEVRRATASRLRARARVPFDKGQELAGRFPPSHAAAEELFTAAVEIDPSFAEAHYARGRSRQALGRSEAALADLLLAARMDASLIMARFCAGRILMEDRRDLKAAGAQFAAMRMMDPDNEFSLLGEGWLATLELDWPGALRLAAEAERLNPSLPEVHDLRGYVYSKEQSGEYSPEKAVESYTRFLSAAPFSVTALNNRGFALIRLGRHGEAEGDLNRALEADPDYVPALTNRGWLRGRRGDFAGALRDLDRAQSLNRGYMWVYMNRGGIRELLGEYDRAREDYLAAAGLARDDDPGPYRAGARLELRAGRFAEAARQCRIALQRTPAREAYRARRQLGLTLYYGGQWREAEACLARDVTERAGHHRLYSALPLWRLMVETGRIAEAAAMLRPLAAEQGEKAHLRAVAGYCLMERSEAEVVEAATAADLGALCEAMYYMGAAEAAWGRFEDAAARFACCRMAGQTDFTEDILAEIELQRLAVILQPAADREQPEGAKPSEADQPAPPATPATPAPPSPPLPPPAAPAGVGQ